MQSLVCEACWTKVFDTEAIQKFWTQESYEFCYTTTWARIVQSAENECNWCAFLASVLPSPGTPQWPNTWTPLQDLSVSLEQAYSMDDATPKGLNQCQIDFGFEASSRDWHVEMDLFVDDTDKSAGIVTARPLQSRLNSAEAYSQITLWLDQCKEHVDCAAVPLSASLPSRVIEVAPADSLGVPRLRSTNGRKGLYIALSYCWGPSQPYVLTTRNLEAFMGKLNVEMLPRTILDAIEVTRTLGFKYLWVDSLCIVQDSVETAARRDMDQELSMMDQVYKSAIMTIVAACAPSVTDGFLKNRPGPKQSQFEIPCRLGLNQFFIAHIHEHTMYDDKSEPINTRAWAFQEQLLSPRLLIYASHTLQWQCRTLTCNLGGSYHYPSPSTAPRLPSIQKMLLDAPEREQEDRQISSGIPHTILRQWLRVVTQYSARKSSLPSDKLPALSALAISYASIFGPEYYAGIWARSAVQQLCWCSPDKRLFFKRPTQYRAPSWSWAALDGSVYFPSFLHNGNGSVCVPYHCFNVVEWQTRPKAVNLPYGEVTGGKLIVTTILKAATFDPSSSTSICFDQAPLSAGTQPMQSAQGHSDTAEDNYARPVHCLAMYYDHGPGSPPIRGLILVESSEHNSLFRRMGSFSADDSAFQGDEHSTVTII